MKEVRVRFAPSPTGFLHVGGARTAIFNWLFAKNQGGKFLLRIEDTDPERSKSELSAQIVRSMEWLEMRSDEQVVYQSDNISRYKEVVKQLVESGKAYYAFESAQELELKRKEAQALKKPLKYDRTSLRLDKETIAGYLNEGRAHTVRFLVEDGTTVFDDIVHGETVFQNTEIDDFVILRADGSPIYQLAVVVDDHDMNISHVIRGDDHLSNTPKQILIYRALGWEAPRFAHLPMILDEQKKKLSKRRDTVSVEEFKEQGYLPEALFNFLTLLGFAPEKNKEIVLKDELIKEFTFDRINRKSAVFDMAKLRWINSEYIRSADPEVISALIKEKVETSELVSEADAGKIENKYILSFVKLMKERASTINDFIELGKYFFIEPSGYDEKGLEKNWNENTRRLLGEYSEILRKISAEEFSAASLEKSLRDFAESKNIKPAILIHSARLALTGSNISPGIFELMEALGKERVLKRIENLISFA